MASRENADEAEDGDEKASKARMSRRLRKASRRLRKVSRRQGRQVGVEFET